MKHHYKKSFQQFLKDGVEILRFSRSSRVALISSIFFLIVTFALPIWRLVPLASDVPFIALHYNIYLGVDRFGALYQIFFIPILGLFFMILNVVIEGLYFRRLKTLSLFFAVSNSIVQFILLVAMTLIILINV